MYPVAERNRQAIFSGPIHCIPGTERELKDENERRKERDDPAGFNDDGETSAIIILLLKSGYRVAVITTSGPCFVRVTVIGPIYVENIHSPPPI